MTKKPKTKKCPRKIPAAKKSPEKHADYKRSEAEERLVAEYFARQRASHAAPKIRNKSSDGDNFAGIHDHPDKEVWLAAFTKAMGSADNDFSVNLSQDLINTFGGPPRENRMNMALSAMHGIGPRDEIEGLLAAQMVAIHNAAMVCLARAHVESQPFDFRQANLNQATKLTRTFVAQLEALNRHRGKGQQKMTVEHVHVHAGGQAVVGNVQGGAAPKTEGQPHEQITHAPGTPMPSQDPARDALPVPGDGQRTLQTSRG